MSQSRLDKPIDILLVEDNPGDVELTSIALEGRKLASQLHVVADGERAMAFLHRQGPYAEVPRPDLILLDLNLPRKDGREVLAEIKENGDFKRIPVVIFTSSQAEEDVLQSYSHHANCFVTKPFDPNQFLCVVRSIADFWLRIVVPPLEGSER